MKRKSRIRKLIIAVVVILCLGGIAAYLVLGLGIFDKKEVIKEAVKTYTVASGNLTTEISAAGNLALAEKEDVMVNISYPASARGTIGEVLVEIGDTVTKGQVLATRDKNAWDTQLETLKDDITAKERALLPAQLSVKNAEQAVESANETIVTRITAVKNAEISLRNTEDTLNTAITTVDFTSIVAALNAAKTRYEYVSVTIPAIGTMKQIDWEMAMDQVTTALAIAQTDYDNALAGYTSAEVTLKKKQVEIAKENLAAAKQAVINAQEDVPLKEMSLTISRANLEDAQIALQDARNSLYEAQKVSAEVLAPIDGFITQINISPGDEVLNGAVVMQITNPDKFMVEMSVSEVDITDIEVGGTAWVTVDTLDVTLAAKVTYIAPTATIQSGVVNYAVRVELQEFTARGMPGVSGNTTGLPAFNSSNMPSPPSGESMNPLEGSSGQPSGGQWPAVTMKTIKLRQGLTVTANLVTGEATDVLLVPYAAVTTVGRQKYVEVLKADGATEKRTVTTGITDYSYIVVTDGLTEGEQVVLSSAAASAVSASSLSNRQFQQGGFNLDMGGGIPPSGGGFPGGQ